MSRLLLAVIVSFMSASVLADVWTYTNDDTGNNNLALGYPVPLPVNSLLPVNGFRSYSSLHARHQDLMLINDFIHGHIIGQTIYGRDIWAYRISDLDAVTDEGIQTEGAVLQNGTIHAREWASPEVTTAIIERFANEAGDNGIYDYLINNLNIVVVPVLNIDGFQQTQEYPNLTRRSNFAEDADTTPRDGRMRRKNMRDVDEDLLTSEDITFGVDLNRNHEPNWAGTNNSSGNPSSIVYHGEFAGSEPESRALYTAAELGPDDRLRMYIDTHSYSQLWFLVNTAIGRRNDIARSIAERMQDATNDTYEISPSSTVNAIGSTDSYFADRYEIPSYTLEIEPRGIGGAQYGGNFVSHSGFILPDSEIDRVRNELTDASVIAWYMQAGPAAVKQIQISRNDTNEVVFAGEWEQISATQRQWQSTVNQGLENGIEYRIWVAYNKPMRWLNADDEVVSFPNIDMPLEPALSIEGLNSSNQSFEQVVTGEVADWLTNPGGPGTGYLRYKGDAFMINVTLSGGIPAATANLMALAFINRDFAMGINDANPATVIDYQVHWQNYEATDGSDSDSGGIDRMIRIVNNGAPLYTDPDDYVAAQPPSPPVSNPDNQSGGGVAGILVIFLFLYGGVKFSMLCRLFRI